MKTVIVDTVDKLDVPAGYSISSILAASPLWLDGLMGVLEVVAICFAILVGYSTWRLNKAKTKLNEEKRARLEEGGSDVLTADEENANIP